MSVTTMSIDDFLSHGEARVLWNRFESLVGQQVFRLRVEGETANVPSSLCSLLSCDLSSPERISQFEPGCMQPGGLLQRNTNALEIDKQPLYGLPYIAQSTCPLLSLILLNIQELRSLDRHMDPCEAIRRIRDIKRSLIDVHKKALLLESQLHQYINPTLVTTLNRRSAKATFEAELMCKLIDKLRKDSRQSASEPEKRKRVCELTMKLKALLCRQKCEWQCVGRLKETLAIARDMKGVLKFICQLSCLLEHCSDASRRLTERPPPYEYCSPYDSGSKQDSSDALYEDLKLIEDACPPYQSQSSHSQVTISLSLDFTSDKEFESRSDSSDDSSRTRTSSYRHRSKSRSHSRTRDYSDAKTDSGTGTLSSRRRTKDYSDVKSDSDAAATLSSWRHCKDYSFKIDSDGGTLSAKKRRKSRHDCKTPDEKSSKNHIRRAKSASSFSSKTSSRRSRKHYNNSEGKASTSCKSCQQTAPTSMEASEVMHDTPSYSRTSRSVSPEKMASPRDRLLSKKLAEKTINELIGVLEDYMENKSESVHHSSASRSSPGQTSYKSVDASRSDPTSRQTFHVDSSLQSETSPSKQWSRTSPKFPNRPSSTTCSPVIEEESMGSVTHNELQDSHTLSRQSFTKDFSSGQSHGWSSGTPHKSEIKQSLKDSKRSPLSSRMSRKDLGDAQLSRNSRKVSYQNLKEVKSGRNSHLEGRLSKQFVSDTHTSSPDFKSGTMSKQIDLASMGKNLHNAPQDEIKSNRNSFLETTLSKQNNTDARASSPDFKSGTLSKQMDLASMNPNLQNVLQDEIKSGRNSLLETTLNKQNLSDARTRSLDFISSKQEMASMSKNLDNISQGFRQNRFSQGELNSPIMSKRDETRVSRQNTEEERAGQEQLAEAMMKTKESQKDIDGTNQMRSSQREMTSARSSKCSEWKRKSMEDLSDRASQRKTDQRKITMSNVTDHRQCKPICDQLRMSIKSMNENEFDETRGRKKSMDEHDLEKIRNERDSGIVGISRVHMERQRQLARECADVVRRRIASISPPPSGSKQAQPGKQLCASTSPPRVRRDIDIICGRFEKNSLVNSESTDSKNNSELSTPSKRKPSKIMNSPLSVISESKDYQSSNTEVQELEEDVDTNNMEDLSTNRNISDSIKQSPKQVKISKAQNKCRHRRTTPTLMSRISEDCKFYMQPRCDNSDSSGSRDPLLFASQETGFSCDCDDDGSDLSYKVSRAIKRRLKTSRSQRTRRARKSSQDEVSDLIEDTTTTTDSCAYDEGTTSVPRCKSYSGRRQQRSRAHHMDDTEGDMDKESDFEEELELKDSPEQFMDKESRHESEQSLRRDRKSSVYPEKSESHHSSRSVSQSSQRSGSGNESPLRQRSSSPRQGLGQSRRQSTSRQRKSSVYPEKRESHHSSRSLSQSSQQSGSINESPPRQRSSSPQQGSGQSRRQSSSRSSDYKRSGGRTPSLLQSGGDLYQQQPYMSPGSDHFNASDGLMQAGSTRPQSRNHETDLRASDLAYVKSPVLSESAVQAASLQRSRAGSKRSIGRSGSLNSAYQGEESLNAPEQSQMSNRSSIRPVQSLMESERPAILSRQRIPSGSSQSSRKESPSALSQSPVHGVLSPRFASSVKFASLGASLHSRPPTHAPSAISTHSAVSECGCPCEISGRVHRDLCEMSGQVYRDPCEMSRQVYRDPCEMSGQVYRDPCEMSRQVYRDPCEMSRQVHRDPCEMSRHVHMDPCEMSGQVYRDPCEMSRQVYRDPCEMSRHVHRDPCEMSRQVHRDPCFMSGQVHTYPSTHGVPEYAASRHGSHFVASEVPQIQPPSPQMSGHVASYVGSPPLMYPAGSVHSYQASKSEQQQMSSSPPGIYPAGSVHGYHSSGSQLLQMPPGVASHGTSNEGSFAAAYPAGSVQGYPSTASENSRQAQLQVPVYQAGSMHGYPSLISHQSQFLPTRTLEDSSTQIGSPYPTHSAVSAHGEPFTMFEQPQIRPTTPAPSPTAVRRPSIKSSYAVGSKHSDEPTIVVPPQLLHLTPIASQQQSVGAASSVPYPEAFAILGEAYRLRSSPGVSQPNSEVAGQQTFQQAQRVSHQSSQPNSESSAVVELSQMIQLTPRSSQQPPMRASTPLPFPVSSAALDQPLILQLTPRGSLESSIRAPSTVAYSESSVAIEQHQMTQMSPGGSQHSSMRLSSLPHTESSVALEQRQRAQLTPRGSQQSSVRAPSSLPQTESTVVSDQPQILQLTPRGSHQSSVRAPSSLPQTESTVVSDQPQILQVTPRGSHQSSVRAPSSLPQTESTVVSDQTQILQLTPKGSQQSSVRVQSSSLSYPESNAVFEQRQVYQIGGLQSSSERAPSLLPHPALMSERSSVQTARSDLSTGNRRTTEFSDQQEVVSNSHVLTSLPEAQFEPTNSEVRQSRQSNVSDMSRHSPHPAGGSETHEHMSFQSEMSGTSARSQHSLDQTDYSYGSRNLPSKSVRHSSTQKSVAPEEAEMATSYIHPSTVRTSIARTSLPIEQISSRDDQNGFVFEERGSVLATLSASSSVSGESRERWWWVVPLVIIGLIVFYYIICNMTNSGGCAGCRVPLPNIFFYLINSAIHSVRLIHSTPAPA